MRTVCSSLFDIYRCYPLADAKYGSDASSYLNLGENLTDHTAALEALYDFVRRFFGAELEAWEEEDVQICDAVLRRWNMEDGGGRYEARFWMDVKIKKTFENATTVQAVTPYERC